ncbi:MAG: hypothetical protein ACOYX5_08330 [Actinomycetota bacterium]
MPRTDGREATRRIMAGPHPRPRVVVLTTFDAGEYVLAALQGGARAAGEVMTRGPGGLCRDYAE